MRPRVCSDLAINNSYLRLSGMFEEDDGISYKSVINLAPQVEESRDKQDFSSAIKPKSALIFCLLR